MSKRGASAAMAVSILVAMSGCAGTSTSISDGSPTKDSSGLANTATTSLEGKPRLVGTVAAVLGQVHVL